MTQAARQENLQSFAHWGKVTAWGRMDEGIQVVTVSSKILLATKLFLGTAWSEVQSVGWACGVVDRMIDRMCAVQGNVQIGLRRSHVKQCWPAQAVGSDIYHIGLYRHMSAMSESLPDRLARCQLMRIRMRSNQRHVV